MERYESTPLPLSPTVRAGEFSGAQLIFYDVDHSGDSFEARVFINTANATVDTPREAGNGYAGSFVIFGHGGCVGDEGHCDVPAQPKDPFDSRPLHALTPQTKTVDVGEALNRVHADGDSIVVDVLAIVARPDKAELQDVLEFSAMRLVTYD
jgi:tyrosinase